MSFELIRIHKALTISEVRKKLSAIDIKKTEKEIKQYIFLLEKLDIIITVPKGNQKFFVAKNQDAKYIDLKFIQQFDVLRYQAKCLLDYFENDKKRHSAIIGMG